MTRGIGAEIVPKEPVHQVDKEGPLDQWIGLEVDPLMKDLVLLRDILGPDDLLARCPALGEIDCTKPVDGASVQDLLDADPYLAEDLALDPLGRGLRSYAEAKTDRYSVTDARWAQDRDELIWRSVLLAQMHAKLQAVSHLLADPGAVNFDGTLDAAEAAAVARRASELAARLKDEALSELTAANEAADGRHHQTVSETREHLRRYVVTRKEDIDRGGLTEAELRTLFEQE